MHEFYSFENFRYPMKKNHWMISNLEVFSLFSSFLINFLKAYFWFTYFDDEKLHKLHSVDYFNYHCKTHRIPFQFCRSLATLVCRIAAKIRRFRTSAVRVRRTKNCQTSSIVFYDANKKDGVCCSSHQQKASQEFFAKNSYF